MYRRTKGRDSKARLHDKSSKIFRFGFLLRSVVCQNEALEALPTIEPILDEKRRCNRRILGKKLFDGDFERQAAIRRGIGGLEWDAR